MGKQSFADDQLSACCKIRNSGTLCGVNTLDLDHLHLHGAALFHVNLCHRIQDTLAIAVAGAVMLLNIFNLGILSDIESMNTIMLGILHAAVVNAAAGYDDHIAVLADIEVIVNGLLETALAEHDRDMYALMFGTRFDLDINTALIGL